MHNHPFSYNTYITKKKKKKAENKFQSPLNTTGVVQTEENAAFNSQYSFKFGVWVYQENTVSSDFKSAYRIESGNYF